MTQTIHSLKKGKEACTHWLAANFFKLFDKSGIDVRRIAIHLVRRFGYKDPSIEPVLKLELDENGLPIIKDEKWQKWYEKQLITPGKDGGFADIISYFEKTHSKARKGRRTWQQYAQDLIYGWLLEDLFLYLLLKRGINIWHNGTDWNRYIVPRNFKVSTEPDFIIESNGKKRFVELQCSLANFEFGNGVIELRNDKLLSLRKHNALLIQFDPKQEIYSIIDTFTDDLHSRILYHSKFYKIMHDVVLTENNVVTKKFDCIVDDIKRCCEVDLSKERLAKFSVECGTKEDYARVNRWFDIKSLIAVHGYCITTNNGKYRDDEKCNCGLTVFDLTNPSSIENPKIDRSDGTDWFDKKSKIYQEALRRAFKGTSIDLSTVFTIKYDDAKAIGIPLKIDINKFRFVAQKPKVEIKKPVEEPPMELDCSAWA